MICISIIIVNYNTASFVDACITSIISFTHEIEYEIILVDNCSVQRDIDDIHSKYPDILWIQSEENIGFGRACNLAVQQSKGSFLLFLNPDTLLVDNAVKKLYDFWYKYNPFLSIGCLGTTLKDQHGLIIHSGGNFPAIQSVLGKKLNALSSRIISFRHHNDAILTTQQEIFSKVDYITGANLFTSRENFQLVGGFDPRFFMYFEETDLQLRLNKVGKFSFLLNKVHVIHFQGVSTSKNKAILRVLYLNGLLNYFRKHYSPIKYYSFKAIWLLLDLPTFLQKLLFHKQIRNH